jgi:hypothetical protein
VSTIASEQASSVRSMPRFVFGAVLFAGWIAATIIWVASTIDSVADGDVMPLVTALAALGLITLLAGMEGLEVAAIDRWRVIYPERTSAGLAAWLAARQFFVAAVVTSATLLVKRDALIIPGTSAELPDGLAARLFDLFWTGLTVLWFGQIFPKHLAATNPDRYLKHLRTTLFPVVDVVRKIGMSQPGEWTAAAVERRLDWPASQAEIEEGLPRRQESLGEIWRQLIPESAPRSAPSASTRSSDRSPPEADRP